VSKLHNVTAILLIFEYLENFTICKGNVLGIRFVFPGKMAVLAETCRHEIYIYIYIYIYILINFSCDLAGYFSMVFKNCV
jgi:hypothetical protein